MVGPEKKEYILITSLATKGSQFFASALKKTWQEGLDKKVVMLTTSTTDFDFYVHWLYTGTILLQDLRRACRVEFGTATEVHPWGPSSMRDFVYACQAYRRLMRRYLPADFLLDSTFKNAIITAVFAVWSTTDVFLVLLLVKELWHKLPDNSMMKRLIGAYWAAQYLRETLRSSLVPDRLTILIIAEGLKAYEDPVEEPDRSNPCEFHEHGEGISACEQMLQPNDESTSAALSVTISIDLITGGGL